MADAIVNRIILGRMAGSERAHKSAVKIRVEIVASAGLVVMRGGGYSATAQAATSLGLARHVPPLIRMILRLNSTQPNSACICRTGKRPVSIGDPRKPMPDQTRQIGSDAQSTPS